MNPLELPTAAEVAQLVTRTGEDPGAGWLQEVRVVVVLAHPGGAVTERGYLWELGD